MSVMRVSKKLGLLAVFACVLPWMFAQTSAETVGSITSALRARDFDGALRLLQPALTAVSEERATVDAARDRLFRRRAREGSPGFVSQRAQNLSRISSCFGRRGPTGIQSGKRGRDSAPATCAEVASQRSDQPCHAGGFVGQARRLRRCCPAFRAERSAVGFSTQRAAAVRRMPGETETVGQSNLRLQPAGSLDSGLKVKTPATIWRLSS